MAWPRSLLLLCCACAALGAAPKKDDAVPQDVTIRGKSPAGPPVEAPAPQVDKAILQEVVETLDVYKSKLKIVVPKVKVAVMAPRFLRPFPEAPFLVFHPESFTQPHDSWFFEVYCGDEVVWKVQGAEPLQHKIEWKGEDSQGRMAVRVGKSFHYRFTGVVGGEELALTSDALELRSLKYKESLGDITLEVGNALLFQPNKSDLRDGADEYLEAMAIALARGRSKDGRYAVRLYQAKPSSDLARARGESLRKFFSDYLLLKADRIAVDIRQKGDRGDVTSCQLPPEKGAAIKVY